MQLLRLGLVCLIACSTPERVEQPSPAAEHLVAHERAEAPLRFVERGSGPDVVVLLHGYGAPGDDLVAVADALVSRVPARFVMPEAPYALSGDARAWFDPPRSRYAGREANALQQVEASRRKLLALLDTIRARRVVLAGFSQGAMMAVDVALHDDRELAGLAVMSGAELPSWPARYASRQGLPVFLSHGREDPVIPFADGERIKRAFEGAGAQLDWQPFDGRHEIRPVLESFATFLTRTLPPN